MAPGAYANGIFGEEPVGFRFEFGLGKSFMGLMPAVDHRLDIKEWPEIKNPEKYASQKVIIGTVTDGYLPQEETYMRTRKVLEELKDSGADILICTKSDLVLRDLDLLREINEKNRLTVSWSVNTLDEGFCEDMDDAVSIERRLAATSKTWKRKLRRSQRNMTAGSWITRLHMSACPRDILPS